MAVVQQGIDYAKAVVSGDVISCRFVFQACQRFLVDLQNAHERGLTFDTKAAQHILNWYRLVPYIQGEQAGQPIELMDWHVFILINLFGWKRADGYRRFRTAYIEVGRKNAKSTLSSGIGLYMAFADMEQGAEVYSAATTREQAKIVFETSQQMVRRSPALRKIFKVSRDHIRQMAMGTKFEPLSSDAKTLDGLNIHCGIVDEIHAHRTREVWDVLETATGSRKQPLMLGITTAGFNKEGIAYELRDYVSKILSPDGVDDDSVFGVIYTLDEDDDPWDESVWKKANPGLGVCKEWDDLQRLAKKAQEQVQARVNFLTKHMNIWVSSSLSWMDMKRWSQCPERLPESAIRRFPCWLGVDLANKIDIAAAIAIFKDETGPIHLDCRFWLPEVALEKAPKSIRHLYQAWAEAGFITVCPGEVIDHYQISNDIECWLNGTDLKEVAFDPWSAAQWANDMQNRGFELVEVGQSVKNLSEAMKEAERLVYAKLLHHGNNPVMDWMMSNVVAKIDHNENLFPRKEQRENKIDGPTALFTGLNRVIVGGGTKKKSIYSEGVGC